MNLDPALRARLHQLLREYGSKVRILIDRHCLGQYGIDAADIEQEVHIRLWKALERDRNAAFHTSYIQRTVMSTVVDAIRAANSRPSEPLPEEHSEGSADLIEMRAGPERSAGSAQDFGVITACMAELPERRRQVVSLHLQGFSFREIGSAFNVSEEAARKLLDRGMETLRERLRSVGFGEFDE
jgi:RNA polymerase sigma factor (sigma-70 family)